MKPPRSTALNTTADQLTYNQQAIAKILAGNVSFGTFFDKQAGVIKPPDRSRNILVFTVTDTAPGTANLEFAVTAGVGTNFFQDGHIPLGFIVIGLTAATTLYNGTTAWTASTIYLKSSVASVGYTIMII